MGSDPKTDTKELSKLAFNHRPQSNLEPFPFSKRLKEQIEEIGSERQQRCWVIESAVSIRSPKKQS